MATRFTMLRVTVGLAAALALVGGLLPFWEGEPEHQDYLVKYPNGSCHFPRPNWKLPKRSEAVSS